MLSGAGEVFHFARRTVTNSEHTRYIAVQQHKYNAVHYRARPAERSPQGKQLNKTIESSRRSGDTDTTAVLERLPEAR